MLGLLKVWVKKVYPGGVFPSVNFWKIWHLENFVSEVPWYV